MATKTTVPIPQDEIKESFVWRDWFQKLSNRVYGTMAEQDASAVVVTGGVIQATSVTTNTLYVPTGTNGQVLIGKTSDHSFAPATLTAGTNITITNAANSITINSSGSMVYPGAGIPNSTGTAWDTSYSTTGTGTVVALATSPSFTTPLLGTPTSGVLTTCTGYTYANLAGTIPTWNQNTTGSAATLTTGRTISITGDLAYTSTSFDGSANVTAAGTLATVNTNVGSFTNTSLTVNAKGLITAASSGTAPVTSVTGTAPVVSSGGTTPAISMPAATTSVNGYLTSTDWTTFNNKGSGTVTAVSVVSANGFAGSSSGGATPALTLSTSITGVLKGNATAISAATVGTDYSVGTSALVTGILKSTTTTGALSIAVAADFPTLNQSTTGSAATLTTPRAIYGNNFDGSAALTQVIASTYGGTGNGFTKFSGATTSEKTYSLPDATTTILTTNTAVTAGQGGTGQTTYTVGDILYASATGTLSKLTAGTINYVLTSGGAGVAPSWAASSSGATISNDTATATNVYPLFAAATSGSLATAYTSNAKLLYKPSTGEFTSSILTAGNGIHVNSKTVATSYTIATGYSGMSAGPITIASGQTVTISSGSKWVVL